MRLFLLLLLAVSACRPLVSPDRRVATQTRAESPEEATSAFIPEGTATPLAIPSVRSISPTAVQLFRTQISSANPSGAALFLRERSAKPTSRVDSTSMGILFVSMREGTAEIHRMYEDGTGQVLLTRNGSNPAWSPDGQQIAFIRPEVSAASDTAISHLFVMAPDGTESGDITARFSQSVEALAWSPDSQQIAFVAHPVPTGDAFSGSNIYVVNRDGSGFKQITQMDPGTVGCWSPTWSPDSLKLAFVCRSLMNAEIIIADVHGSQPWRHEDYGQVSEVFWLPSGNHIGFTGGLCWSVGVISGNIPDLGPYPCLDPDFEALGIGLALPYGISWSPLKDTLFAVQTENNLQIVDLTQYAVGIAPYRSTHSFGAPS